MSSATVILPMASEEEKDPLELDVDIEIKQEVIDNFEGSTRNFNDIIIKTEANESGANNVLNYFTSSEANQIINRNDSSRNKGKVIKILPFSKKAEAQKKNSGVHNNTVEIKKEPPCNCMQNIEYYCNKCDKTLHHGNEVTQCFECNNQLKLQCRLCHKRYKLLKSIHQSSISTNIKKEIDIKEECQYFSSENSSLNYCQPGTSSTNNSSTVPNTTDAVLFCCKCEFSTTNKVILNTHIWKSHWQTNQDIKINCDDDMYIELLCKKCQKICRKVVYDELVKLVCRECRVPMLYRCTLCRTRYKLLKNVRYHVKLTCPYRTDNEKFYCADCAFKTETKVKLENHIIMKHLNQQCSNCNTLFQDNDALREHVLEHCTVKNKRVPFDQLELPTKEPSNENEIFIISQNNPQMLVKGLSGKPPKESKDWRNLVDYLCLECGGEAKKKFARYRPWCRKCNLKYDYRCISCEKLYGNYDRILRHVKFGCSNRYIFECPLCKFNASKKSLLVTHIETNHTIYKCMECFINVEGFPAMKKHQSTNCCKVQAHSVTHIEKLISLYCKKCFKRPRKVADAVKEKCDDCRITMSYQCLRCLNLFNRQDLAYKHIQELCKPKYACSFENCIFKTYTREALDTHTKYKHTNRVCEDCGVSFKDELIFQLHRREEIRRKAKKHLSGMGLAAHPKRFKAS